MQLLPLYSKGAELNYCISIFVNFGTTDGRVHIYQWKTHCVNGGRVNRTLLWMQQWNNWIDIFIWTLIKLCFFKCNYFLPHNFIRIIFRLTSYNYQDNLLNLSNFIKEYFQTWAQVTPQRSKREKSVVKILKSGNVGGLRPLPKDPLPAWDGERTTRRRSKQRENAKCCRVVH